MPSLYPAWTGKIGYGKKKKKKVAFPAQAPMQSTIDKAMRKAAQRRNAIIFKNVPGFDHVERKHRDRALLRHQQWESMFEAVPLGTLHWTCHNLSDYAKLPRQTCAWLVAKYCTTKNVTLETLSQSITRANADPKQPGLMWRRDTDQRPCVNLHKLDNESLYRVYCSIPDDHRPVVRPELPKAERPPRPPKKEKVPKNKRLPQPKALPIIEEQFAWVQCDCCDKWRRLFNTTEDEVPDKWQCSDHPDELTCDMPEDTMDAEEQWDGKVQGTILKISFGGDGAPSVRVVEPESQGTEPADSDDDMSSSHDHSSCGPSNEGKTEVSTMPSSGFTMEGESSDLADIDDDTGGQFAESSGDDDDAVDNLFGSDDDDDDGSCLEEAEDDLFGKGGDDEEEDAF